MSFGADLSAQSEPKYFLYCYSENGERLPAEFIDAEDDRMAIDIVLLQLKLKQHCTLWDGERLVFSLPEFA